MRDLIKSYDTVRAKSDLTGAFNRRKNSTMLEYEVHEKVRFIGREYLDTI